MNIESLKATLANVPGLITNEGTLNIPEIHKQAQAASATLITALAENAETRAQFFQAVNGYQVFLRDRLIDFVSHKHFLANSFTQYKNKIGLANNDGYIKANDRVVLRFPFKDCVLEGGQSKDDEKRQEVYLNEVLAQVEIDRLFAPKVLTGGQRINHQGATPTTHFNRNEMGNITDNLLIKGNNLIALHSLAQQFTGKVKLIYIDPPYNTGTDSFQYNDNFNHSTWLVFMKNRLEIARKLLRDDGVIFVQCDDNEQAYLKVLMDEVFGREQCHITMYIKVRFDGKTLTEKNPYQKLIEIVFVYTKSSFEPIRPTTEYKIDSFCWHIIEKNSGMEVVLGGKKGKIFSPGDYEILKVSASTSALKETWATGTVATGNASGKFFDNYISTRLTEDGLGCLYKIDGIGEDGLGYRYFTGAKREGATKGKFYSGVPLSRLEEMKSGISVRNEPIVNYIDLKEDFGNSRTQGGIDFGAGKKPEQFLEKIMSISTKAGDLVLDFFAGSGTTAAVAHKMGRQWIAIEQMDYINTVTQARLEKVVAGEQGGISQKVNWQGGGEFVYCELKAWNAALITEITQAANPAALIPIREKLLREGFLDYRLNLNALKAADNEAAFQALTLDEQKRTLIAMLDKNQLYIAHSERGDISMKCTDAERTLSESFYQK